MFLFGQELAATTSLNTQTVLMAVYQKAAAAATAIATAAANAFGVSVGVATAGISVLVGLLATAAASLISFGANASNSQKELTDSVDESNDKLREQQKLIDALGDTNAEIRLELMTEGLEKDLALLNADREKAIQDYAKKYLNYYCQLPLAPLPPFRQRRLVRLAHSDLLQKILH